ncbi:CgeB family protein [Salipaludibacillus sp. CF4.18]|uniref:CgeB family protein n=1 Tax=Salipaludibacillus sp. CF4.18 TaxID=3373081 RepID=UPI003EE4C963
MLKDLLLKNKLIWNINKHIKANQVEKEYEKTFNYYKKKDLDNDNDDLLKSRGWTDINKKDLKIFYLGGDPLQDFGGFIQALTSMCNLKLFYKRDGSYGQYSRGRARDQNLDLMCELFSKYKREENWIPDILMMQSFGFNINTAKMKKLKEIYGFKIINIGMDERLSYKLGMENGFERGIAGLNEIVDLVLVTTPECVEWYLKENIPAIYFPLASDEEVYFPAKNIKKKYDVGFIGRNYGVRKELVSFLEENGLNIKAYGPGWENGVLDVSKNNEFYNSCKIVLGTANIGYSSKLMNPKLRDFEVPLSGTFYITNYTKELNNLFEEDKEIVFYNNKEELIRKLRYYLQNDMIREEIAAKGYDKAVKEHRYKIRLRKTFEQII